LISPSTAVDISRPMPFETTTRAPFSDIIPLDSGSSHSRVLSHFHRSKSDSQSTVRPGSKEGGGGGFAITVERETVVTVAAQSEIQPPSSPSSLYVTSLPGTPPS
jgi:hypothetical protein